MAFSYTSKRVLFPPKKQKAFLNQIELALALPQTEIAKKCSVGIRSYSDWKREKNSIPYPAVQILCDLAKIDFPKKVTVTAPFSHLRKIARSGGIALHKKYGPQVGDRNYRKKKWREWWNTVGIHKISENKLFSTRPVLIPELSEDLAEFVGIMLGDGGIAPYQITITLNSKNEKGYGIFIKQLIIKLFGISPVIKKRKNISAFTIVVSRKELVVFCCSLGLVVGHKIRQEVEIPQWIMNSQLFRMRCLRGLVDTDGCLFQEKHVLSKKTYAYPRLNFTSHSPKLISCVFTILKDMQFHPAKRRGGKSIQLENISEICQYFKVVGTNNPKIAKKHEEILDKHGEECLSGLKKRS